MRENNLRCETCKQEMLECPGHFGYMKLALPIYHIGFFGDVINILQCICKVKHILKSMGDVHRGGDIQIVTKMFVLFLLLELR